MGRLWLMILSAAEEKRLYTPPAREGRCDSARGRNAFENLCGAGQRRGFAGMRDTRLGPIIAVMDVP